MFDPMVCLEPYKDRFQECAAGVYDVEQTLAKEAELGNSHQHLGFEDLLPGTEGSSVPYQTQIYSR
jgi:hypothetical protein